MTLHEDLAAQTPSVWWDRATNLIRQNAHQSTENHYVGGNGAWNVKRKHKAYITQVIDTLATPCEGKAAIVGGMPGAGKSRMIPALFDPQEYYVIDPDDIKDWLIDNGLAPEVNGLTPRETGPLLHVESTTIAKKLSEKLAEIQANVIWPMTFSVPDAVTTRVSFTKKHGYKRVDGAYVLVSLDTSERRVKDRYVRGMQEWLAGQGLGGRFIDLGSVKRVTGTGYFEGMSNLFDTANVIDNNMDLV